jgi:hypothetical protein
MHLLRFGTEEGHHYENNHKKTSDRIKRT